MVALPSPEYDDSWNEQEEEALAERTFAIDTTGFTTDGSAKDAYMAFNVKFNVTADYDKPDILTIRLETDAPTDALLADY